MTAADSDTASTANRRRATHQKMLIIMATG
jgi:hypothetical protein